VSWLVVFERLVQADCLHVFLREDRRPHCASYWTSLKQRPSYRKAIVEESHPTIEYGTRRLAAAKQACPSLRLALEGPIQEGSPLESP
jgi:hypothetical protein